MEKRNECRILLGWPGGKRPLGRSRLDIIKMDVRENVVV
jgi:hypothetical protein